MYKLGDIRNLMADELESSECSERTDELTRLEAIEICKNHCKLKNNKILEMIPDSHDYISEIEQKIDDELAEKFAMV